MSNHVLRIVLVFSAVFLCGVIGLALKASLVPRSFGLYGAYRADAIDEEAARPIRHGTNESCLGCHTYEAGIHLKGRHRTISCEFCHGTWADHVKNGKKIATLPVKKGDEITRLCLRCHNTEIKARSQVVIKTVAMPDHLRDQKVKETHTCNQCHHVHAPLKYIQEAKEMTHRPAQNRAAIDFELDRVISQRQDRSHGKSFSNDMKTDSNEMKREMNRFRNEHDITYPLSPSPFMEKGVGGEVSGQVISDRFLNEKEANR